MVAKILFQLSGSIASYKSCQVISRLAQDGHELRCVVTRSASRFIGNATLEGLSGHPVFHDVFEDGRMIDHINLTRWAEIAVLCPATADTINRLAAGLAGDPVGALFLAWNFEKTYLIFPAMNHRMWSHPATVRSVQQLKDYGATVLPPADGHQACGEHGTGRLVEPPEIYEKILMTLKGAVK